MATVYDVAEYFLSKDSMTQKKLQKLTYYAYAWTLTLLNESEQDLTNRLFPQEIQAWVHGPVCPELYSEYKSYGWDEIPKSSNEPDFSPEVKDILDQVWDVYGCYNGNELESISHQEDPWKNARKGLASTEPCKNTISDKDIYKCYIERVEA